MIQNFEPEISEYVPLKDVVFRSLRWAILKGDLMPGERLLEVPLANQFRVSRTPVREAIRKLEIEGLALMIPGRGAKVAKIEEKDLRDVLEIRVMLERNAIGLACEYVNAKWLVECEDALDIFYQAVRSGEIRKIAESDVLFHDMIFEAAGNHRLIQAVDNLKEPMYRYRLEYIKRLSDQTLSDGARIFRRNMDYGAPGYMRLYREHCKLYEAIKKQDKALARKLMSGHIGAQEQALLIER